MGRPIVAECPEQKQAVSNLPWLPTLWPNVSEGRVALLDNSLDGCSLSLRREARAQCGKGLELYIEHCALVICGRSSASVPYMSCACTCACACACACMECEKDNQTTSKNFRVRSQECSPTCAPLPAFMGSWLDN